MSNPFLPRPEPSILAETPRVLAVYKPCRLHTAPLPSGGGEDLCSWLFALRPELDFDAGRVKGEGGLFHRLDFETSGIVLFARDPAALAALAAAQDAGLVDKDYVAIVGAGEGGLPGSVPARGRPVGIDAAAWDEALAAFSGAASGGPFDAGKANPEGLIGLINKADEAAAVECRFRSYGPGGARVACLEPGRKPSPSHRGGSPERIYRSEFLSASGSPQGRDAGREIQLTIRIRRGFRHQIRAQLAWLGLPILGDGLYGGGGASRLHLHAFRLAFPDPGSGKMVLVENE